ncbi:unnamed protein product, partial [Symbiodinium microadriaticum]
QKTALAVAAGAAATLATTAFVQSGPAAQAAPERSSRSQLRGRAAAQTSATGSSAPSLVGCTAATASAARVERNLGGQKAQNSQRMRPNSGNTRAKESFALKGYPAC